MIPRRTPLPNLRDRVRVERRRDLLGSEEAILWDDGAVLEQDNGVDLAWTDAEPGDGAGNFEGDWVGIGPAEALRAEIVPLQRGGDEEVMAGKLGGVALAAVTLRASAFARTITTDDRFVDQRTGKAFNVRHAPDVGRERFITFTCESGVAT